MLCNDVINAIEKTFPKEYALSWDNVGLLVGRDDKEVKRIYVALDATDDVIDTAIDNHVDMLITHHPMIFGSLNRITNRDFIGNRILKLIQNDISYYAMHTNYDVLGMAKLSTDKMHLKDTEVLEVTSEWEKPEGIGRVAELDTPVSLGECCKTVKDAFHLDAVKVFGDLEDKVQKIAICPGSGKSVLSAALEKKVNVLITGDIGHHEGIDAVDQGMAIIDAGHYGIEHIFIEDMKEYLKKELDGVEVLAAPVCHPFVIV